MPDNVFIDLDGTLLDSRYRLYALFTELVPQSGFSFDEYWRLKRQNISQKQLLTKYFNYSDAAIETFRKVWLDKVEEPVRMKDDRPYPGADLLLAYLADRYDIYLVTARQHPELVSEQIFSLEWDRYFKQILVTKQNMTKHEIIRNSVTVGPNDILVGDTGEDIISGKNLGVKTIAVTSGILESDALQKYAPDLMFATVAELYESKVI